MAGDWIKMRSGLQTHPKVVRIMSALKADRLRVIGGLHAVWCLFDEHSADGTLDGYTTEAIDSMIGWPGFAASMMAVGWLEQNSESLTTPRFSEHNGQSAKRRAQESERKRAARESAETSACDADKKRTREEKRREEEKHTAPPDGDAAMPEKPVDFLAVHWLTARGVTKKHATEWLKVRKNKKATNTETAFESVEAEAKRAGMDLDAAIAYAVKMSWSGFKVKWMESEKTDDKTPEGWVPPKTGDTRTHPMNGGFEKFVEGAGWVAA